MKDLVVLFCLFFFCLTNGIWNCYLTLKRGSIFMVDLLSVVVFLANNIIKIISQYFIIILFSASQKQALTNMC